jgi:ribose transport system substrate-binding protein
MKKLATSVITTAVLIALAVMLAGCGSDSSENANASTGNEDAEQKTIYINQFAKGIRAFTRRSEGIKAAAAENNWEVLGDEYGDGTPETQIKQIQNALVKKPDAILIIPINPEALTPVVTQAKKQGTDVITFGSSVSDPSQIVSFVSYTPEYLGKIKAQFLAEQLNDKGTVGVVNGLRGHFFAEGQKKGLTEEFKKHPNIKVVDGGYTDWTSAKGLEATENLLSRDKNLSGIYYAGDDLAVGGIQGIKERGIDPDQIVTASSDATPAAVDLIKKGDLTYTTSSCSYAAGLLVANTLKQHWDGEPVKKIVPVKQFPVTKDNLAEIEAKPKEECGA